jgi:hypothetical protein
MMVTVKLADVNNTTGHSAAIVLGHLDAATFQFKPWGKREFCLNKEQVPISQKHPLSTDRRVHWLIPPHTSLKDKITVFKSGIEVNSPLAARYPDFDGTVEYLKGSKSFASYTSGRESFYTAPKTHPLVEWLYANASFYPGRLELPVLQNAHTDNPMYQMRASDFLFAANEFTEEFNLSVPVVNLEKMVVRVYWIPSVDKAITKQKELNKMLATVEHKTDLLAVTKIKEVYEDEGSLSFRMNTEHIFRDHDRAEVVLDRPMP